MKKKIWTFTRTQYIVLIIMAFLTVIIFAIEIYYLFGRNTNPSIESPVSVMTTTSEIKITLTEIFSTNPGITPSVTPNQLSTALLPTSTQTLTLLPSSNSSITSATPLAPPPQFFTNEWDDNTNNWKWFSTKGNDNDWDVYNEAGVLVFSLLGKDTNAYFIYQPWDYDKVTISTQIEVRSKTKSTTVIICNYTETNGWYEFDIGTDGLWEVRLHDTLGKTGYLSLLSGGSLAIQTGEGINEYAATCNGNHLTLSINGTEALDFTDEIMKYERGKIGLGVLSFSKVPILIESAWVKIDEP